MKVPTTTALICLALGLAVNDPTFADEPDLIGHWKLAGDANDASGKDNHGQSHDVDFTANGSAGNFGEAAAFDGKASFIEVPDSKSLQIGANPFTVSLWVNTAVKLDDVLGDLFNKYDPVKRVGYNLSIQNYAGVTSSQSNYRHVHFGIDDGQAPIEWQDHGRLGNAVLIFGMAVYNHQLFAGTCEAGEAQSGRVFRFDGRQWTDCGSPDKCNAVSSLAVFQGKLSDVRLYRRALSEREISLLAERRAAKN